MMRKRLINDLPTVVDYQLQAVNNKLRKKNENILKRLTNRESTGYFNNNLQHKSNLNAFEKIPEDLQFCLKEIIPYCYLNQVYMGLSSCGQFLLSYCRIVGDNENESYDFNGAEYKYELFFWIYRPHHPLTKYVSIITTMALETCLITSLIFICCFFSSMSIYSMTMELMK